MDEIEDLIVNLFAGGGGTSVGMRQALGRDPDIAIDHDELAVAMHAANHPDTEHYQTDVWAVLPRQATRGRPVGMLWASPDCTHHSRAKGGPPIRDEKKRDLAWVVARWVEEVRPKVIIIENVEEFLEWGPLDCDKKIIKSQKGVTFRSFVKRIRRHGYRVEWECLRACDYGAPTSRRRLFIIARCDGMPIVWPAPTHGDPKSREVQSGELLPWRTAAETIDWSIPCPSIFERSKPLADKTLKRIAEGIKRYVIEASEPFIVNLTHGVRTESAAEPLRTITGAHRGEKAIVVPCVSSFYGQKGNESRCRVLDKPIATITGDPRHALIAPCLTRIGQTGGKGKYCNSAQDPLTTITSKAEHLVIDPHLQRQFGNSVGQSLDDPVGTIMPGGGGKTALVAAFLAKHYGGVVGQGLERPIGTVTGVDHHSLVTSNLIKSKGTSKAGQAVDDPLHTVQGSQHYGEVRAFLVKYFGTAIGQPSESPLHTITGKDREAVVTVDIYGEPWAIADIGMRMLSPRELFLAQGFPEDFKIDIERTDKRGKSRIISKEAKVKLCGNSVCPPIAEALVKANLIGTALPQMKRQMSIF